MEGKKSFKVSLSTVIFIFMILILIMALAVVYYLGFVKNNQKISDLTDEINSLSSKNNITQIEKTEMQSDDEKSSKNETNNISVVDALNYSAGYYNLFKVKLPRIVGNTNVIEKLNLKILNEILPLTYENVLSHAVTDFTAMDKGSICDYKYSIDNNILIIYIFSTVPEGGSVSPETGGGLYYRSYHYDIVNDKILSVGETAELLKLELEGLKTDYRNNKIESYKELDENAYIISIDEANNIKLINLLEGI